MKPLSQEELDQLKSGDLLIVVDCKSHSEILKTGQIVEFSHIESGNKVILKGDQFSLFAFYFYRFAVAPNHKKVKSRRGNIPKG